MRRAHGNMYAWPNLWLCNPLKGRCSHGCSYCYQVNDKKPGVRAKYSGEPAVVEKELTGWGKDKTIFVCNYTDLFAANVPAEVIRRILSHCRQYPLNRYLLQTKNPARLKEFAGLFPPRVIYCTTIETDKYYDSNISKAPPPEDRAEPLAHCEGGIRSVTIEPILSFNIEALEGLIRRARPDFVSIGADSQECGLKEPSPDEVRELILRISRFTEVSIKDNLKRIIGDRSIIWGRAKKVEEYF